MWSEVVSVWEAREVHERLLGIARVVRAMDEGLPLHPTTFLMIRPSWRRVLNDLALLAASAFACNPFTHSPARPARSSTNTHIHTGFGFISQNVLIQWFWKVNFPTKTDNLSFTITNQNNKLTILWGS